MRKINDSRLYLFFGLTVIIIGIVLSIVSFYSYKIVQPKVEKMLNATDNLDQNYRNAYLILRNPQVFALYENFDTGLDIDRKYKMATDRKFEDSKKLEQLKDETYPGITIKKLLVYFDEMVYNKKEMAPLDGKYLKALLNRRLKGAALARNTAVYCGLLGLISLGVFFYEKKKYSLIAS